MLIDAGFTIREHSFEYSAFPASWGTPIGGVVVLLTAVALFAGRRMPGLMVAALAGFVLALVVLAVLGGRGVLDCPWMRRRGVNLEAVRPGGTPAVWLVAHLDSKWQPVSMISRVAGVVASAAGLIALIALALLAPGANVACVVALAVTCFAAVPLLLSVIGDRNTGALDNASGVAAVLAAAESIAADRRVGVLITDAEELALAGARAWARGRMPAIALNCDSVDDAGVLTVMYSGRRPDDVAKQVAMGAEREGEPIRTMRLIPGILTDSVALTDAGWRAVTLSRGNLRTLQRVHTSHDTLAGMGGTGIARAARVLARTATELG